jgi:hypothetical protein
MKKLLALSILTFGLLSFNPVNSDRTKRSAVENKIENADCNYGQCYATAKSTGKRCKHCVSNSGDTYCWQHK